MGGVPQIHSGCKGGIPQPNAGHKDRASGRIRFGIHGGG